MRRWPLLVFGEVFDRLRPLLSVMTCRARGTRKPIEGDAWRLLTDSMTPGTFNHLPEESNVWRSPTIGVVQRSGNPKVS